MKKMTKKTLSVKLAAGIMAAALLTGCSQKEEIQASAPSSVETAAETSSEAVYNEPVGEELFTRMRELYRTMADNYPLAKELVDSGYQNGSGNMLEIMEKAETLIKDGTTYDLDTMTKDEAEAYMSGMEEVTAAILDVLEKNHVEPVATVSEAETETEAETEPETGSEAETVEAETQSGSETAEN